MNGSRRSVLRDLVSVVLTGVLALVALIVLRLLGFTGGYAPVVAFAVAVPTLVYRGSGPVDLDAESYRAARGGVGVAVDVSVVVAAGAAAGLLAAYAAGRVGIADPWPQAAGILAVVLGANAAFFARNWAFLRIADPSGD